MCLYVDRGLDGSFSILVSKGKHLSSCGSSNSQSFSRNVFMEHFLSSFCKLYETCVTKREKATLINCTNGFNRDKFGGGRGIMNNE